MTTKLKGPQNRYDNQIKIQGPRKLNLPAVAHSDSNKIHKRITMSCRQQQETIIIVQFSRKELHFKKI